MATEAAATTTTKQWIVAGEEGFESLKFAEVPVPTLRDNEVLVRRESSPFGTGERVSVQLTLGCSKRRIPQRGFLFLCLS